MIVLSICERVKRFLFIFSALFLGIGAGCVRAQRYSPVALPSMFSDHMVLQQRSSVALWGWADAGNTVRVVPGWATGDTLSARVDCIGRWRVAVPTAKAGGPYTLEVFCGRDRIVLRDVMLGEVWLCSGQSNMEWTPANGLTDAEREIAAADCPSVRFFQVPKRGSRTLQDDCGGQWETCTPDVMRRHSAVAYFFARHLSDSLGVSVGILESAWGGTPAEVWIPENWVREVPGYRYSQPHKAAPWWPVEAGLAYNRMIHPLLRYGFAGAVWYQGESNRERPADYADLMRALIGSWRREAGRDFPFYMVQIAPYRYKASDNGPALIREAQEQVARSVPGAGLAVVSDCVEDLMTIHPINKRPVGRRLAFLALGKHYKRLKGVFESPFLLRSEVKDDKVVLTFSSVQNGLVCRGKEIAGLQIAGADGRFVEATGRINTRNQLVVSSREVKSPLWVRYCFSDDAVGNLFNREGLPVAPFRTDDL